MSGYSEFEYARAGLQYGCVDYLLKPVYEEDLLGCLEKAARRIRDARSAAQRETQGAEEQLSQEEQLYRSEAGLAKEMVRYMQEHYREVTQQQMADLFCMSASAVSQIIKRHTGKNYSEHLLDIRIQRAQELLRATNESIERIAELTGYNDYFYFTKVFKKATGLSPSAYRKSL